MIIWCRENSCGIAGLNLIAWTQLMGCLIALHWPVLQLRTQEIWADISSVSLRKRKKHLPRRSALRKKKQKNTKTQTFVKLSSLWEQLCFKCKPYFYWRRCPMVAQATWELDICSLTIPGDCECTSSANSLHFSVLSHAVVVGCPWHTVMGCSGGVGGHQVNRLQINK